jgi:hypothetical protein
LTNLSASPAKITLTPIKIIKTGTYKIITDSKSTFINNNGSLLILNTKTNELDLFSSPVNDAKISPDGNNVIYYGDKEIHISNISDNSNKKALLYKSSEKITDCVWLNNYYIIVASANKIMISETDYRDNINTITLPQTIIIPPEKKIEIKNSKIFFSQQDSKLYILTKDTLLASEKILP